MERNFVEISRNLVKYRFENNFVELINQNIYKMFKHNENIVNILTFPAWAE